MSKNTLFKKFIELGHHSDDTEDEKLRIFPAHDVGTICPGRFDLGIVILSILFIKSLGMMYLEYQSPFQTTLGIEAT